MKICISEVQGMVNIEVDEDFQQKPWEALDFIADTISRLQSMALDIEANADDPGGAASKGE